MNQELLYKPVMFFKKNGEIFNLKSIKRNVNSTFFLITSINKNCITIMHLSTCDLCIEKYKLTPTYEYITIEKKVFCGYHLLNGICIEKCNHIIHCFYDCFSKQFTMWPGNNEIVIWESNIGVKQYGTLQLCIEKSSDVKIIVLYADGTETIYRLGNTIYFDHCRKITIKTNKEEKVIGLFKIETCSMVNI